MWTLRELIEHAGSVQAEINGKWVPARPVGQGLWARLKNAVAVLRGRADAFKWPEGQ